MALQASGGNPPTNPISASDIANEFGYTNGSETRLGSYRTTNGQGNFPVSFGALQFNSIDAQTGGSVPTSGQIKILYTKVETSSGQTTVVTPAAFANGTTINHAVVREVRKIRKFNIFVLCLIYSN